MERRNEKGNIIKTSLILMQTTPNLVRFAQ